MWRPASSGEGGGRRPRNQRRPPNRTARQCRSADVSIRIGWSRGQGRGRLRCATYVADIPCEYQPVRCRCGEAQRRVARLPAQPPLQVLDPGTRAGRQAAPRPPTQPVGGSPRAMAMAMATAKRLRSALRRDDANRPQGRFRVLPPKRQQCPGHRRRAAPRWHTLAACQQMQPATRIRQEVRVVLQLLPPLRRRRTWACHRRQGGGGVRRGERRSGGARVLRSRMDPPPAPLLPPPPQPPPARH